MNRRIAALFFCLATPLALAQTAALPFSYVVLGGLGPVARTVLAAGQSCPSVALDGAAYPMTVRKPAPAQVAAFPVTVCEALVPAGTTQARINGQQLALPPKVIHTIAGIGDTGCRIKNAHGGAPSAHPDHGDDKGKYQDCDIPGQWPFARLAASVAKAAPDVVLHVGDYLYREAACPAGDAGCKGSPHGDNWLTWQADFFAPAAPLLKAAPWVAVRGNHEICARNAAGYLLFLDPRLAVDGAVAPCTDILPSYTVQAGGRAFAVIDSSNADDLCKDAATCNSAAYASMFAGLSLPPDTWLVTHKPIWSVRKGPRIVTAALQAALPAGQLPGGISLALAGHIHFWQLLGFADGRPPQMVLGNGGTQLTHAPKSALAGTAMAGTTVRFGKTHDKFGYTLFTPRGAGWKASYHNPAGRKQFDCRIAGAKVGC